jgi:hypothetical protein
MNDFPQVSSSNEMIRLMAARMTGNSNIILGDNPSSRMPRTIVRACGILTLRPTRLWGQADRLITTNPTQIKTKLPPTEIIAIAIAPYGKLSGAVFADMLDGD